MRVSGPSSTTVLVVCHGLHIVRSSSALARRSWPTPHQNAQIHKLVLDVRNENGMDQHGGAGSGCIAPLRDRPQQPSLWHSSRLVGVEQPSSGGLRCALPTKLETASLRVNKWLMCGSAAAKRASQKHVLTATSGLFFHTNTVVVAVSLLVEMRS